MSEQIMTSVNADGHLLLDQSLLRFPNELNRKNLRTARATLDKFETETTNSLQAAAKTSSDHASSPAITAAALDAMIAKAQALKRKLETLQREETSLHEQQRARLRHIQELEEIPSLTDDKYDQWSRVRLDRMLADYLLRTGCYDTARKLTEQEGLQNLVDVDAFVSVGHIEQSLKQHKPQEALTWCAENRKALKEAGDDLELELRLQQFIELTRSGQPTKLVEAALHARKYLTAQQDTEYGLRAWGLLAYPAGMRAERYEPLYSSDRWDKLADHFVKTHNVILGLPNKPLLHIALSAGLSTLKTPACHSVHASSSSNASSSMTSVCPICSTELNELARKVPYAHHSKSWVENDPVVLPNGRIYGRERLMAVNEKLGVDVGKIRDPTNPWQEYDQKWVKKVFIS